MLRPSSSGVSGLGSERPSRVPIPAARMTTWTGAGSWTAWFRARVRSVLGMSSSSVGGGARRRGGSRGGEEEVEHPLGGVPVVVGVEGPPERGVAPGAGRADGVDVAQRGEHLVAGAQQGARGDLLEIEVEPA